MSIIGDIYEEHEAKALKEFYDELIHLKHLESQYMAYYSPSISL